MLICESSSFTSPFAQGRGFGPFFFTSSHLHLFTSSPLFPSFFLNFYFLFFADLFFCQIQPLSLSPSHRAGLFLSKFPDFFAYNSKTPVAGRRRPTSVRGEVIVVVVFIIIALHILLNLLALDLVLLRLLIARLVVLRLLLLLRALFDAFLGQRRIFLGFLGDANIYKP